MMTQSDLMDFLGNPENVQKLNDLVEDIRYVLMDYQVCPPKTPALLFLTFISGLITTNHL